MSESRPYPSPTSSHHRALSAACLVLAVASCLAIWWQDFGGGLPFVLFNDGKRMYLLLARVTLVGTAALALALAYDMVHVRPTRIGDAARAVIGSFLVLELLVTALDVFWVGRPAARIGGPYREATSSRGSRAILRRPRTESPLGFRNFAPYDAKSAGPRVLFLGDSYTEGSGSGQACNYPDVAVHTLDSLRATQGKPPFSLLNAGVAGYGPRESLALFHYLRDEGYTIDAVVLSLFTENDFTDDLPGTDRRVTGGIVFRYPSSTWLRWLHPLNTHTARYAMMFARAGAMGATVSPDWGAACYAQPVNASITPAMRALVTRRLEDNYGPRAAIAPAIVSDVLKQFADETRTLGIPFVVVVFPDRIVADGDLRSAVGIPNLTTTYDLDALRRYVREHSAGAPVIDLTDSLRGGAANYLTGDTHLSDEGNTIAGRVVGQDLARRLLK